MILNIALWLSPTGIVGAIDCTHVRLYGAPMGDDEYVFVNRKGFHSLNVQMICSAKYKVTNIVARWPGSTHDSAILHASIVRDMFENGRFVSFRLFYIV